MTDTRILDIQSRAATPVTGHVLLLGAGPGDPELLTLKALRALEAADVILHDRLISDGILALAPAAAQLIPVGKEGFGPAVPQEVTNGLMIDHARRGERVVRLKSGDPGIFGRLEDEVSALEAAGVAYTVIPGITAAAAAAASLGQGLTQRGRNAALRVMTGYDMAGFAEQDWRGLAAPGSVAAIYMAKRSARFIQGRLMMHGAAPDTPVTVVENASRPDQATRATTLVALPAVVADMKGPAVLLYGIAPRAAAQTLTQLQEAQS